MTQDADHSPDVTRLQSELVQPGDNAASAQIRRQAASQLGHMICDDDMENSQKWQVTQLLVKRCFGAEPDPNIRFMMMQILSVIALSDTLESHQSQTIVTQMTNHLLAGGETDPAVRSVLELSLDGINGGGLTSIYADNAVSLNDHGLPRLRIIAPDALSIN